MAQDISLGSIPVSLPLSFIPRKEGSTIHNTEEATVSFKRMVKLLESMGRNARSTLAAIVSVCISRKR